MLAENFNELPDGVEFSYFRWVDKVYLPTETELKLFAQFKGVGGIVTISPKPLDADIPFSEAVAKVR